jgi:hypothetical protein
MRQVGKVTLGEIRSVFLLETPTNNLYRSARWGPLPACCFSIKGQMDVRALIESRHYVDLAEDVRLDTLAFVLRHSLTAPYDTGCMIGVVRGTGVCGEDGVKEGKNAKTVRVDGLRPYGLAPHW